MSDWTPVLHVAKNAQGQFQVFAGGSWQPALSVAKNAQGEYVAQLMTPVAAPTAAAPAAPKYSTAQNVAGFIGEPVLSAATSAVAQPLANIAGLVDIPLHAAGISKTMPEDVRQKVASFLTYQPKTAGGKFGEKIAELPGKGVEKVADIFRQELGPRTVGGEAVGAAIEQAPALLGMRVGRELGVAEKTAALKEGLQTQAAQQAVKDAVTMKGRQQGYVLAPSKMGKSDIPEGMSSSFHGEALDNMASAKNADVTNKMARKALGLPPNIAISPRVLNSIRAKEGRTYDTIAKLPGNLDITPEYTSAVAGISSRLADAANTFPEIVDSKQARLIKSSLSTPDISYPAAIQTIRVLRRDSRMNLKNDIDPERAAMGQVQSEAADALEGLLEQNLSATKPKLMNAFRAARVRIAKTHAVEEALNTGTGDVSAHSLRKQLNRGDKLTGELQDVANFANAYPEVTRDRAGLQTHGSGWIDTILHEPLRRAILSKAWQTRLKNPKYVLKLRKDPRLQAALAVALSNAAQKQQPNQQGGQP